MATLEALELLEGRKEGREWCDRIVCGKGVPRQGRKGEPVVPFQSIRGLREMPAWENYSPSHAFAERAAGSKGCCGLEGGGPGPHQGVGQFCFNSAFCAVLPVAEAEE